METKTVRDIIEIGESLHKIKLNLKPVQFNFFCESELPIDCTTAFNFMRICDTFGNRKEEIAEMGLTWAVLYFLSARSTPKAFRDQVLEQARAGNPPSFAEVKELRKEFLAA